MTTAPSVISGNVVVVVGGMVVVVGAAVVVGATVGAGVVGVIVVGAAVVVVGELRLRLVHPAAAAMATPATKTDRRRADNFWLDIDRELDLIKE
jgi:hypothetical protein